eukprot:CAMPEP_0201149846 /NCGR_PEP_ID=MMETSP0851-20130426/11074_1 /ASSEMBLY_ACC=CAM_ASM_000631 /TAXON_ID=183588 /ORGANISM="Pseudo-nitzschia fraudulenta, Strain WWA7" /LENGTH=361 /DNA_ID=CAMNT_0047426335 /DNA_START=337 /DNA_END=1422 /DNA_ORIENTATION=-
MDCIDSGIELLKAIRSFYKRGLSNAQNSFAARSYGWPIAHWCLSTKVVRKLDNDSHSPLPGHISNTLEKIVEKNDDDNLLELNVTSLISDWNLSLSDESCLTTCSATDGTGPVSATTATTRSYPSQEEEIEEEEEEEKEETEEEEKETKEEEIDVEEETEEEEEIEEEEEEIEENPALFGDREEDPDMFRDSAENSYKDATYDIDAVSSYSTQEKEVTEEDPAVFGDRGEDQAMFGDNGSTNDNDVNNPDSASSGFGSNATRNKSTTGMLIRLIPVKLVALLSLMCLVLGIRQMCLSPDIIGNCSCCKLGCSIFGLSSDGYASYEGIDPSDITEHEKVVEFELLQLAESGDMDHDIDVVIS